jgi:hypothetical protein
MAQLIVAHAQRRNLDNVGPITCRLLNRRIISSKSWIHSGIKFYLLIVIMIQYFKSIPQNHIAWINTQQIFWIATAPLAPDGHVNVSPKGVSGTFHVMNPNKVWYEDLTGSGTLFRIYICTMSSWVREGVETISHLRENGRITVMFNAFEGPPRILRLWGKGNAIPEILTCNSQSDSCRHCSRIWNARVRGPYLSRNKTTRIQICDRYRCP